MANYSKKFQDPTEAALSAIQEALSIRTTETRPADVQTEIPAETTTAQPEPRPHPASAPISAAPTPSVDRRFDRAISAPVDEPPARPAANDDRQSIGQILQNLQHRPPRTSYLIATLFALAWVAGGLILAGIYLPNLQAAMGLNSAALVGVAAVVLAPIAFFFILAHMVWRAQELRLIAQSMASVAMRLAEPEEVARESIVSVGQAIRREVAAMGDGVERALARASELETLVANEVSQLERTYHDNEMRIRGIVENLAHQRDAMVAQSEQIRHAISAIHLDLTRDINSTNDLVAGRISETTQQIAKALSEKGEHITLALGRAGDSMIGTLSERGGDLLERLERTSQETTHAISAASDRLTTNLNFKADHVSQEFTQLTTNLSELMHQQLSAVTEGFSQKSSAVIEMMESRSQQMTDTLIDTSSRLAETIVMRADDVNNTLKSTGDSFVLDLSLRGEDVISRIAQTGAQITAAVDERANSVTNTFRESADQLVSVVGSRSESIKEMLAARLQAFDEMFAQSGTELAEKIERDTSMLGGLITRHLVEFDSTVKTYGTELVDRLGQRTQEVNDSMRGYLDGFDANVGAKTNEVAATLEQRLSHFQESLDTRTQTFSDVLTTRVMEIAKSLAEGGKDVILSLDKRIDNVTSTIDVHSTKLAETIGNRVEAIDQLLGARASEVAENLDSRIGRLEQMLIGRAETVAKQIETHSKAAADMLGTRSEQITHSIKTNSAEAERTLTALASGVNNTLKQSAGEVQRVLVGVSNEVARNFVGKANEITTAVNQRAAEMTNLLDEKSSGFLAGLSSKSKELTNEVGRVTDNTVKSIEAQGITFARTMLDNGEQIARLVNEASENATGTVNRTLKDLQQSTQSAIEQSKQAATASVSEIMETNSILRADTTTLFERLSEANTLLQEVLRGAHQNMSTVENTLAARVSEFVVTMNDLTTRSGAASNQIDERIASFHAVTSKALNDLSQLSSQFETHGQGLLETVTQIDDSNRRTESTLADRRAALDALVSALDTRTEDLEQRLRRFSGMLDESLPSAAAQAREIARVIAESSSEGAQAISNQFEIVRSISQEERAHTSETLRSLQEQTMGETRAIFEQALQGFGETLQGVKQMAMEMQQELDSTRSELRRGILELPQETAESAAQMRRVIVDQIEALAELNRIVARHGRGMDAAEPARRATREEPLLSTATPRVEPPPTRPMPRADLSGGSILPAPRRAESPAPGANYGGNGRNSGWLSDLLQRASRPPESPSEDRPARHTIESLDSLSVDIARMIDHDAATELWDRYKRGERNVFTRRLYTLQGQKAFDDIRKKYQADREFKQTVDRYISEFERLLEEVARDDRGQVVARTYLTSETGKVYTMLAHASGRFGD